MSITIGLNFGAMEQSLTKQVREQGYRYDEKEMVHFEKDAEAIFRLSIRKVFTDYQTKQVRDKLFKRIESHIRKMNKS